MRRGRRAIPFDEVRFNFDPQRAIPERVIAVPGLDPGTAMTSF
jgi:hypothetical protein